MKKRGELVERSFAHIYDTGGMRRTHLRGHDNILKRLLIHVSGFNLGLVMRTLLGYGTPPGLRGRLSGLLKSFLGILRDMVASMPRYCVFPLRKIQFRDFITATG
jgi:hypothetical protein